MAFGNNPRENFSFLPNTLLDSQTRPHRGNGFFMGEPSSRLHFHHGFQQLMSNKQYLSVEDFSKNPFSGVGNRQLNLYESLRYNSSDDISYYDALGAAPVAVGGANQLVHRVESRGFLNCPQGQMNQGYWTTMFEESASRNTDLIKGSFCITEQKKRRKRVQERRIGRLKRKVSVIKGQWTPQEDSLLIKMVVNYGEKRWSEIAKHLDGRVGKQCRERWHNHLRPNVKKDPWTEEEEKILIEAHKEKGNKWAEISKKLPGRTENTIKNHWNATKRRYLSSKSYKSPKSGLLEEYVRQVCSAPQTVDCHPNAYNNLEAAITNQQVPRLVPTSHNCAVNASLYTNMVWENRGLMKFNSSHSCNNAVNGSLINEMPGGSVIGGENIMGVEMPVDFNTLMQFGVNKVNLNF